MLIHLSYEALGTAPVWEQHHIPVAWEEARAHETDLEGLHKGPEQDADGITLAEQLDEPSSPEKLQEAHVEAAGVHQLGEDERVRGRWEPSAPPHTCCSQPLLHLGVRQDDLRNAADDRDEVKDVPGVPEIILQEKEGGRERGFELRDGMAGLKGAGPLAKAAHGQWWRPRSPFVCSHGPEHRPVSETVADLGMSAASSFSWDMIHASNRPPWQMGAGKGATAYVGLQQLGTLTPAARRVLCPPLHRYLHTSQPLLFVQQLVQDQM